MFATHPTFPASLPISNVEAPHTITASIPPSHSTPQLSTPLPTDPPGRRRKSADSEGRRNDGPSLTRSRTSEIPTGWRTTRQEVAIPGQGMIYWHDCLDTDANMDRYWAEELLFQRADFFRTLSARVEITGNPEMAKRIRERLDRRRS